VTCLEKDGGGSKVHSKGGRVNKCTTQEIVAQRRTGNEVRVQRRTRNEVMAQRRTQNEVGL
jgi:hypothetical protein